jgi:two-component sensor histidine kinase
MPPAWPPTTLWRHGGCARLPDEAGRGPSPGFSSGLCRHRRAASPETGRLANAGPVVCIVRIGFTIADIDLFAGIDDARALALAIVNTVREPLLVLDEDLRVVAASRSFYLTFRVERQKVEGVAVYALGDGQWNIPELRLLLEKILPRATVMEGYEVEHDFVGLGRRKMLLNARKLFYEEDTRSLILLAIEDVTERRAAQREAAELLQQRETLLREMQHRVANSLQIIASILLLKARAVGSQEVRGHLQDAHRRVMSVAAVQQQLQASGHGEQIRVGPYLSRLCESLAASMIGDSRPVSLEVQAGDGRVSSDKAVSVGLIVTELVINALKHAFVDETKAGTILIAYEVIGTNWRLSIADNGVGKTAARPERSAHGLGTSIVEALAKQLDSRVEITETAPHGTTVSLIHGTVDAQLPKAA